MNERIKELWEQAVHGDKPHASVIPDFAELIVKDLCSKLEPVLAKELLDLYGVEE